MAKIIVKYVAIDPYYSTTTQTFIGENLDSCDQQKYEFEKWLGRNHSNGIASIYKIEIIKEVK